MAPRSLLVVLSLALSARANLQLPHGSVEEVVSSPILSRSLPLLDDALPMGILPVPPASKRAPVGGRPALRRSGSPPLGPVRRRLPTEDAPSGTLALPVVHAGVPGMDKRDVVPVELQNRSDVAYYAQLNIGTPPQTVFAQLDTGSFELWVNPDCSSLASAGDESFCQRVGKYSPSRSSTAVVSNVGKSLRYGIGAANITYVDDNISLAGSATMRSVRFGVATASQDQFSGILGIGHGQGFNTEHKNFIDELAAQGLTKTKSFSVALGSKDEKQGAIVFGGVDTSKFAGNLAPLPIIPASRSPDGVTRYWVSMNSLSHTAPDGRATPLVSAPMVVFLDTGATMTLLPPAVVETMGAALNASAADRNGFSVVDCAKLTSNGSFDFAFDGVTIRVPYREMIREVEATQGGPATCYLGVMKSDTFALLGDTFLRSAYVVFDLDANMTFMAPYANCGPGPGTIMTISALSNLSGLPGRCGAQQKDVSNGGSTNLPNGGSTNLPNGGSTNLPNGGSANLPNGGSANSTNVENTAGGGKKPNAAGRRGPGMRWLLAAVGAATWASTLGRL